MYDLYDLCSRKRTLGAAPCCCGDRRLKMKTCEQKAARSLEKLSAEHRIPHISDMVRPPVRSSCSRDPASLATAYSAYSCSVHVLVINESLLIRANSRHDYNRDWVVLWRSPTPSCLSGSFSACQNPRARVRDSASVRRRVRHARSLPCLVPRSTRKTAPCSRKRTRLGTGYPQIKMD